jgi:hypothetical protein
MWSCNFLATMRLTFLTVRHCPSGLAHTSRSLRLAHSHAEGQHDMGAPPSRLPLARMACRNLLLHWNTKVQRLSTRQAWWQALTSS